MTYPRKKLESEEVQLSLEGDSLECVKEKVLGFPLELCSIIKAKNFPASEQTVPTPETDLC